MNAYALGAAPAVPALPSSLPLQRDPAPSPAPWGAADALAAVGAAAGELCLPGTPSLVRAVSSNVVFRLGDLALKVYSPSCDLPLLSTRLEVLASLDQRCFVGPVRSLPPVLPTPWGAVTFWPWGDTSAPASWPEVGSLLSELPSLEVPGLALLPRWTPFLRLPAQLTRYLALPGSDPGVVAPVLQARSVLLERASSLPSALGYGLIHGDVSLENTMSLSGSPRLIDLDTFVVGPRENDLSSAARRFRSGELSPATYRSFVDAYGFDVTGWEGSPVLEQVTLLGAIAFVLGEPGGAGDHPAALTRLRSLLAAL